jgi:hypothetical protein
MGSLVDALRTRNSYTENGMVTNSSTLNACVDLFFSIGAMRGQSKERLLINFSKAFNENPLTAMRILFWVRDVRGGAGERQIFRDIISYLAENHSDVLGKNLSLIPEFGRWDDLLTLFGTCFDTRAKQMFADALATNNGLAAKWCPRKGKDAIALERFMGLTPKQYRKLLVENTKVVETAMCQKEWESITYEHVPSVAMARYSKAFANRDTERFNAYKNDGDVKINASAVYPYDVLKTLAFGDSQLATKQWNSLPNYLEGNQERVLPVCDVSGSMDCSAGGNKNLTCLTVCISLGLYISERNEGPFKNAFITFEDSPKLNYLNGDLKSRYLQLSEASWGRSTNLEGTFIEILNKAKANNVPESEMPTAILIMSDMEFNSACNRRHTALDMIKERYAEAGYVMPKIIFWNLQSRNNGNNPAQVTDKGVGLISGFSPSILKSVLSGKEISPMAVMNEAINTERYECVTV